MIGLTSLIVMVTGGVGLWINSGFSDLRVDVAKATTKIEYIENMVVELKKASTVAVISQDEMITDVEKIVGSLERLQSVPQAVEVLQQRVNELTSHSGGVRHEDQAQQTVHREAVVTSTVLQIAEFSEATKLDERPNVFRWKLDKNLVGGKVFGVTPSVSGPMKATALVARIVQQGAAIECEVQLPPGVEIEEFMDDQPQIGFFVSFTELLPLDEGDFEFQLNPAEEEEVEFEFGAPG